MKNSRIDFSSCSLSACCLSAFCTIVSAQTQQKQPNVILIITDDQGYGDLGITGNPHVKTPVLDKFGRESIRFNNFYVSPVSAPTRSSLMTGRYSMRTGVRDTYNGGAIMASTEITIAEMLKDAGYTTGIFGKWHLGDNYPCRPGDQGFDESVIHLAGGMAQPGDVTTYPRGDSAYFDPILWHNGRKEKYAGYCSDIFAGRAIEFIEQNKSRPFFCYLAFNAPHTPLQVPEKYYTIYRDIDPTGGFENGAMPFPKMTEKDKEDARRVYAMVTNIDENIGQLLGKLDDLHISENTVVIFMTDNGPQQRRYVAGMRGLKGSVYRGGVRVPFFIRYPAWNINNKDINATAAHIDVLPTIARICNARVPADRKIDGVSLLPLIKDEGELKERALFFYWTRRNPEKYNNVALMKGKYKLAGHTDYDSGINEFELFDIENDPYEQENIVKENREVANNLKAELDSMFTGLADSPNMIAPPCIETGTSHENPVILNRNDAGGDRGIWEQDEVYGLWDLCANEGYYNLRFIFKNAVPAIGRMVVDLNSVTLQARNNVGSRTILEMKNVHIPGMRTNFVPYYETGGKRLFPLFVEVELK
jgi:arylsulfatase A-like enzyme